MSISGKLERSALSREEYETVRLTHHPAIAELDDRPKLVAVQQRLRALRGKERTLSRQRRREARGKSAPRGGSFPATAEQPLRRKQIFAAALKRINREIGRLDALTARSGLAEAAQRALALKRANAFVHHPTNTTAHDGMQPISNRRRRTKVHPSKVGRVSQQTKTAQTKKDAKG